MQGKPGNAIAVETKKLLKRVQKEKVLCWMLKAMLAEDIVMMHFEKFQVLIIQL